MTVRFIPEFAYYHVVISLLVYSHRRLVGRISICLDVLFVLFVLFVFSTLRVSTEINSWIH